VVSRATTKGSFSESDQVTQVLTPEGTVLESTAGLATLLTDVQLQRASESSLFFTGIIQASACGCSPCPRNVQGTRSSRWWARAPVSSTMRRLARVPPS